MGGRGVAGCLSPAFRGGGAVWNLPCMRTRARSIATLSPPHAPRALRRDFRAAARTRHGAAIWCRAVQHDGRHQQNTGITSAVLKWRASPAGQKGVV